jgi:dolichyl-phosphate-mannose--protein O-mannosyl transferase
MNNTDKENTMKWYHSMLTDGTDEGISSKRMVTLLAFILCAIAFVANLFFGLTVDEKIFEGMMYIAIAGLGFTASEKFTKK